jgi:DNA topoisomerase-2
MSSSKSRTDTIEYKSVSQIEHILLRPNMYIGNTKNAKEEMYVAERVENKEKVSKAEKSTDKSVQSEEFEEKESKTKSKDTIAFKIVKKPISYNAGLCRLFIEILSNAIDNTWRSKEFDVKMTKIKINITEDGMVSIYNDGFPIRIEKNDKGIYIPEMIFGKLLTGSNYNDEKKRLTSGLNGLGSKLTNIFSKYFKVKVVDPDTEQQYIQEWSDNMSDRKEPKITKAKSKVGSTEITFMPDFARFGVGNFTDDMRSVILKHIIDTSIITDVNVYYNDEKIPMKNIGDYVKMFSMDDTNYIIINTDECKVALMPAEDFSAVSFVNGIETKEGGVHVDAWCEAIFRPLLEKYNPKKGSQLTIRDIKSFFRIFVFATLPNPEFSNQEKTKLTAPVPKTQVDAKHINSIGRWEVIEKIKNLLKSKELTTLKKTTEKKRGFTKIEGLDPANLAGGKHSTECSLILCEGLSAKTYAVKGIEVGVYGNKGRDRFGIYALRGKVLNTRNASVTSIGKNREITDIIKALNLKHGVDYTDDKNFNTLNYGKIMIMTDSDVDGIHIAGLIINFFHSMFPSLLKREESYIVSMKTPIVKVSMRNEQLSFYTIEEFKTYMEVNPRTTGKIKYYKGLGTSNDQEIKESFGQKVVEYIADDSTDDNMNKVFHTKFADQRKEWLERYNPEHALTFGDRSRISKVKISEFIDGEMIKFSIDDCKRSIPNIMDGLKESHRKILYSVFLKNLKYTGTTLKVAQLAGFVAEKTNYHHGEQCLYETIIKMAHEFPGSNNIPLLFRDGQFGSRLSLGKDAASGRYIFTKLDKLTRLIFREEDDPVLNYIVDDGDQVEPEYYVPIIPTILVNGIIAGIGTGWSTSLPAYNPKDIIDAVKTWIESPNPYSVDEDGMVISELPDIKPWYRGFNGTIEKSGENKYETRGIFTREKVITVTELPISMPTDKFKDIIEDLIEEKKLKGYKNYSSPYKVHFEIEAHEDFNEADLKLKSSLSINNMVTFNSKNMLQKYDNVEEIIDYFCKIRLIFYTKRKEYILAKLIKELKVLQNRERFLSEIIAKTLIIFEREEEDIIVDLEKKRYDKDEDGTYGYLLNQKIKSLTKKQLETLREDIVKVKEQIKVLESTTEREMWLRELTEFSEKYDEWVSEINDFEEGQRSGEVVAKGKGKSKGVGKGKK